MPEQLIIHINPQQEIRWISSDDLRVHTSNEAFPEANATVFVPTQDILITQVSLPNIKPAQIKQALPYAMEDQLAEDIEDLHVIALGRNANLIEAAVVRKDKLHQWLDLLNEKKIHVSRLLPDIYALPYQEGKMTLGIFEGYVLVRSSLYQGYSLEMNAFIYLIEENQIDLNNFHVMNFTQNLPVLLRQKLSAAVIKNPAELLALALEQDYPDKLNLLQGIYSVKTDYWRQLKPFRLALGLLMVWLLIAIGGKIALFAYYHYEDNQLQRKINQLYAQIFPGQTAGSQAGTQLLQAITRVQNETQDPFLNLLAEFGKIYQPFQADLPLQGIAYNKANLMITIQPKLGQADNLIKLLQSQGLMVTAKNNPDQTVNLTIGKARP